ncbi:hypothetical protein BIU82_18950 [Arthrobacter sp. SW1]|nr:hypothetical protein BIU82_18950 [Arthrobacter sp. SW1]
MQTQGFNVFRLSRIVAALSATSAPIVFTFAVLQAAGNPDVLAQALGLQILAQLAALLVSGPLIDRLNRKWFLVAMQAAAGTTWACFAVVLLAGDPPGAVFPAFGGLTGLVSGLNGPATQSVLSHLVAREELKSKLADLRIALNTVSVIAPVAAGILLGVAPAGAVVLGLAAANLASALQLLRLPAMKAERPAVVARTADAGRGPLLPAWFWAAVAGTALMNVLWAGYYQLNGPVILRDTSTAPELAWGIASAALGAGMVLGGIVFKRVTFAKPRSTPLLLLAGKALPLAVLGLWPHPALLAFAAFCTGVMLEAFVVNFHAQLQLGVPGHFLGTAYSLDAFVGMALMPAGYALAASGSLDRAGSQLAAAGVTAFLALAAWFAVRMARDAGKVPERV